MRRGIIIVMVLALSLMLVSGACAPKPEVVTAEEFYQTNTVTIITNGSVGGSTDYAARLWGSYWAEITGGPAMINRVMPGGGGIEGVNYVYAAKPDGLTLGNTHHPSDMIAPYLLETPGPEGDPRTLGWIGFFGATPWMIHVGVGSPYQTVDDLRKAGKVVWGAADPGSVISVAGIIAIEIFGLDADVVFGLETGELALALKRGEIAGACIPGDSALPHVENELIKPLVNMGFERSEWFPDTPAISELVELTPEQEDMIVFLSALVGGKSFYFPPGIAADKLNYVRGVFDKIVAHKGFLRLARKRYPVWSTPITGEQLEADVLRALAIPPERTEAIRNLVHKYVK